MTTVEQRYREQEDAAEAKRAAKARRQPVLLIALINVLTLAVALTAVVDLRRLDTPGGTALAWTQAAVFGDCDDYLRYSLADGAEPRSRTELCRDLRGSTATARSQVHQIGLTLGKVTVSGRRAEARLTLTRKGAKTTVTLRLVKSQDGWRVLRDQSACLSVGCA